MSFKQKLIFFFLAFGFLPFLILGLYSYYQSSNFLEKAVKKKLVVVRVQRSQQIKAYFDGIAKEVFIASQNLSLIQAVQDFSQAFENLHQEPDFQEDVKKMQPLIEEYYLSEFANEYEKRQSKEFDAKPLFEDLSEKEIYLQGHLIAANQHALGEKDKLFHFKKGSHYSRLHNRYHNMIRTILQQSGYYDIFLIDLQGRIVYSVYKELDFATSLVDGPYQKSNFGVLVQDFLKNPQPNELVFKDYDLYAPSYDAPASFVIKGLYEKSRLVGLIAFQMPLDLINEVAGNREGLDQTEEIFLVGVKDRLLRSDSTLNEAFSVSNSFAHPDQYRFQSSVMDAMLTEGTGLKEGKNYKGRSVFASYGLIDILGSKWGVVSEISVQEALASVSGLRWVMILMGVIGTGIMLTFSFWFSHNNGKRMKKVGASLLSTSEDLNHMSTSMTTSANRLKEQNAQQIDMIRSTNQAVLGIEKRAQVNAEQSSQTASLVKELKESNEKTSEQILQIQKLMQNVSENQSDFAIQTENNEKEMEKISALVDSIGDKTQVINKIVFQTKILSFNASVEAARAGDQGSGKGFAVVAEEVGELANLSGEAAIEIGNLIEKSSAVIDEIVAKVQKSSQKVVKNGQSIVNEAVKLVAACLEDLRGSLKTGENVDQKMVLISEGSQDQSQLVTNIKSSTEHLKNLAEESKTLADNSFTVVQDLQKQTLDLKSVLDDLILMTEGKKYESSQR